jgi:hypothetical protein
MVRSRAYGRARVATALECGQRVADAMARKDSGTPEQRAAQIVARSQDLRHHDGPIVQLDLDGGATPLPSAPCPGPTLPKGSGRQLSLPLAVPVVYQSPAWNGTVEQPPLDLAADGEGCG